MEQLLTKLKTIQPNKDFQNRSKALIFSRPQLEPAGIIDWWPAISLSLAAIVLILSGLSVINTASPSLADSLDQEKLATEVKSLDIQIQLSQVQYYQDSIKKMEVALKEISGESEL